MPPFPIRERAGVALVARLSGLTAVDPMDAETYLASRGLLRGVLSVEDEEE